MPNTATQHPAECRNRNVGGPTPNSPSQPRYTPMFKKTATAVTFIAGNAPISKAFTLALQDNTMCPTSHWTILRSWPPASLMRSSLPVDLRPARSQQIPRPRHRVNAQKPMANITSKPRAGYTGSFKWGFQAAVASDQPPRKRCKTASAPTAQTIVFQASVLALSRV